MCKSVIILGAGGRGKIIADIIVKNGDKVKGFLDDNLVVGSEVIGFPVLGKVSDLPKWKGANDFIIGIGTNKMIRQAIDQFYKANWYTAIHPSACIAMGTEIGEGTVIMANAVVNVSARIGRHCIINTAAIVEHDNIIGDFTHLSPNSTLGGTVVIGDNTNIAIGASVRNGIRIASNCMIGVGAVVVKDIVEPGVYIGVPAKRMRQ